MFWIIVYLSVGAVVVIAAMLWRGTGPHSGAYKEVLVAVAVGHPVFFILLSCFWPIFVLVWYLGRRKEGAKELHDSIAAPAVRPRNGQQTHPANGAPRRG